MTAEQKKEPLFQISTKDETVVATSAKRYLAFLVDYGVIMLFLKACRPLFLPQSWDAIEFETNIYFQIPLLFLGLFMFVIKDLVRGVSVGKVFFNLRVSNIDKEFTTPSLKRLIIRNLFLFLLPLEIVLIMIDKYCQRWGDKYALTIVVEHKRPPQVRHLTVKVVGVFFVIASLWMMVTLTTPMGIKKSGAYQMAEDAVLSSSLVFESMGAVSSVGYWPDVTYHDGKIVYKIRLEGNGTQKTVQVILNNQKNPPQVSKIMILEGKKD
ncbi:MAG: RDD family protein [Deltaproteobacteria bacterium]|nr:RDD family protein [Deltaproteobacteria bacterium]